MRKKIKNFTLEDKNFCLEITYEGKIYGTTISVGKKSQEDKDYDCNEKLKNELKNTRYLNKLIN